MAFPPVPAFPQMPQLPMAMLGIILFGFLFLFVLISLLLFGNGYRVRYLMAAQGIGWESLGRRGKAASRLAMVAGALAGNASVAGAGLLAAASESGLLAWKNVRTIKAYPAIGVISIINSWRVVIRIYCTPQYYAYAIQWLRWGAAHARYQEIGAPPPASAAEDSAGSLGLEFIRRLALGGWGLHVPVARILDPAGTAEGGTRRLPQRVRAKVR